MVADHMRPWLYARSSQNSFANGNISLGTGPSDHMNCAKRTVPINMSGYVSTSALINEVNLVPVSSMVLNDLTCRA